MCSGTSSTTCCRSHRRQGEQDRSDAIRALVVFDVLAFEGQYRRDRTLIEPIRSFAVSSRSVRPSSSCRPHRGSGDDFSESNVAISRASQLSRRVHSILTETWGGVSILVSHEALVAESVRTGTRSHQLDSPPTSRAPTWSRRDAREGSPCAGVRKRAPGYAAQRRSSAERRDGSAHRRPLGAATSGFRESGERRSKQSHRLRTRLEHKDRRNPSVSSNDTAWSTKFARACADR